jgi:FAD/FMN-containing dehydrogenase
MTAIELAGLGGEPVKVQIHELEALGQRLGGSVLLPSDAGFEKAALIWNGMITKRPALVVQPVATRDVREAVDFARAYGLLLSIKGGGHNIAGLSIADGGLTLDMSRMRAVEVDAERRVARVDAGCLLGDVDRATQEYGLATVLGTLTKTGVGGLTLGGGFGYLTRRFGMTVDNLEEVEIVTADGKLRRANQREHEDLFWALRGGGGNFGVVTQFTFRLHKVGPEITGGLMFWDAEKADEVIALYRELTEAAPRELMLWLFMRRAPQAHDIPGRWRGKPVIGLIACHTGDPSQAAKDLAPLRAITAPIADLVKRRTYVEQQSILDATQPNGMHQYWKSEFLSGLSDALLETFQQQAARIASPMSQAMLFQLGGALTELEHNAVAFANRDAAHILLVAAAWAPDTPDAERHRAWARSIWEAIRPYGTGGNYINVQTDDEDQTRINAAYRDNLDRLARIKAGYDPENLFRVNRNIPPAAESGHRLASAPEAALRKDAGFEPARA